MSEFVPTVTISLKEYSDLVAIKNMKETAVTHQFVDFLKEVRLKVVSGSRSEAEQLGRRADQFLQSLKVL